MRVRRWEWPERGGVKDHMRVRRWEWPERGRSQGSYEGEKVGVA